jgi:peptidoglycan/xylan/chitin deacetylase (PgdA/CDA1 family)
MGDVLVLCYHALSGDWPAPLSIPPERLEAQLTYLVERGYRGTTFTEAITAPPARKTLAVTFDDGFRSVLEHALPIMAGLGLPGTAFVPTAFVGRKGPIAWPGTDRWLGGPHEKELTGMSWDELGRLAEAGWEVGSHTCTHPRLSQLDEKVLHHELTESRRESEERLGVPVLSIAYPYGDVDGRVVRAAERAGYVTGAALPDRIHARRTLEWPRVGIYQNDPFPRFRSKVSRVTRPLVGSPPGEWLLSRKHALQERRLARGPRNPPP